MLSLLKKLAQPASPVMPAIYINEGDFAPEVQAHVCTQAVVDFTNIVMHDALFLVSEFPEEAFQIYNADFYVTEVMNGGHAEFLRKDRTQPEGPAAIEHALAGMELIGCAGLAEILRNLQDWVARNPLLAVAQDGVINRAEALDDLDADFFAHGTGPFHEAVKQWMCTSPVVAPKTGAEMGSFILGATDLNPRYAARRRVNKIAALDAGLTTDTAAAFRSCVAGATARDLPFDIKAVLGGDIQPSGEGLEATDDRLRPVEVRWALDTSTGPMTGVINAGEVEIFATNPEDGKLHLIFERPMVRVQEQLDFAAEQKPARYAYEIGQTAFPDDPIVRLGFLHAERDPAALAAGKGYYVAVTESGAQHILMVAPDGAAMCDLDGNVIFGRINGKAFKALSAEDTARLV